ncbi:hypothetical protein GNI_170780 [Gregarina niphandrodes]|uniref:Uncharacterized protein n=1 Tax=Gregarina niphandrodes TaxID=110365 RepID=A0A023AXV8_GRENI|nr:hypothetical protein GNI_170780 [Gregarina niphandrodes]EZG43469.1 hypothetical protein GNI_170780 [Gregarina niphandrodes]|eukprot:XP_011133296.1 hypothetical protein GNI_170780 [Gregarina niphandrodes]
MARMVRSEVKSAQSVNVALAVLRIEAPHTWMEMQVTDDKLLQDLLLVGQSPEAVKLIPPFGPMTSVAFLDLGRLAESPVIQQVATKMSEEQRIDVAEWVYQLNCSGRVQLPNNGITNGDGKKLRFITAEYNSVDQQCCSVQFHFDPN